MTSEEIIQQILSKHPEISREEILETLKTEKNKTGNLIADATLLRLIAAKYGVEIFHDRVYDRKLSISHLVPSLNDVTVSGRVVAVYPVKTFEGKRSGKFASLVITDKEGILRVMLWNDKVSLIESGELKTGQVARFSHGYTREDRNGKAELHLSDKSVIEINPQNVRIEDFPSIGKFATKIKEITKAHKNIHLLGVVKEVFPSSTFTRQDQSTGKVLRFTLADSTDDVAVVVWNEKAEELEQSLKRNVELQLVNAKVKTASSGGFEIHVDASTYVDVSAAAEQLTKIASLNADLNSVNVEGEVSTKPVIREVTTSKGENVKLAVFELKDDSGTVRVSAWRKHAEAVNNLKVGDRLRLTNAYVKKDFGDKLELSTRNATSITVL
ncbi:MAG TPA: OB-fold nucleic acid binding domain-containing protein [Candidatus Bathyarchaeia archaeon]|nr:OB-fold nucleic acid binding domain-containing protein [Candidatus Bathyarchaeia archaeon]